METIVLPKKVTFNPGDEEYRGQVIIEPCYPGYGTTLGNSLRRVLLSSLSGAAIVGMKIKGATHEFTTLDNVKEDILEIILNLKSLRLNIFSDEVEKLELSASGVKAVTAKDISKNSNVEIINQDLHIAEITDKDGSLEMEIFVSKGMGYGSIEGREDEEKEVGYIDIDSIFTPVKAVKVDIENVRVGKMTNWEKLVIDIKTDGTIDFKEAFRQSIQILVDQFSFLLNESSDVEENNKGTKKKSKSKKKDKEDKKDDDSENEEEEIKGEEDSKTKEE